VITHLFRGAVIVALLALGLFCAGVRPPAAAAHSATGKIDCAGVSATFTSFEHAETGHVEASDNGVFFVNGPVNIAAGDSSQSWPHAFTPGTHTVQLVITWPSSGGDDYNSHPVSLTCSSGTTTTTQTTTTNATTTVVPTVSTTTTVPVTTIVTAIPITLPAVTTTVAGVPQPPVTVTTIVDVPGAATTVARTVTTPPVTVTTPPVTRTKTVTTRSKPRIIVRHVKSKPRVIVKTKTRIVTRLVRVKVPAKVVVRVRYRDRWHTKTVTRIVTKTKTVRVRVPYTVCPKGTHKVPGTHACGVEGQG
jgi:hypothetical protein